MLKCVICKRTFNSGEDSKSTPCSGGGHILQENLDGTRHIETGPDGTVESTTADFVVADGDDLRRWAETAKKLGYKLDD